MLACRLSQAPSTCCTFQSPQNPRSSLYLSFSSSWACFTNYSFLLITLLCRLCPLLVSLVYLLSVLSFSSSLALPLSLSSHDQTQSVGHIQSIISSPCSGLFQISLLFFPLHIYNKSLPLNNILEQSYGQFKHEEGREI